MALTKVKLNTMVTGNLPDANIPDNITITNAGTATALQNARTINGTSFDGTANITVTSAAGTLTGNTLASGVTSSSLTSVGTLTSLNTTGAVTATGSDYMIKSVSTSTTNGDAIRISAESGLAQGKIELDWFNDSSQAGGGYGMIQVGKSANTPELRIGASAVRIGSQQGSQELKVNRSRMRHIDGVADANANFSHGDLYVNHISTGNIYMQRATYFASTVQVDDNDLTVKMNNHASGIRVNVDRKDTNDYGGFEVRTGGSQRWFVGMRELGNDDLQFFNGNSSSGSYQNVLSLNHSNANATFAEGVAINGASIGSHKLVVDNGTTSFNRGNSSGNILELRGLNSSQVVFATGETTYGTSSVNNNVRVHGNLRMNAANSISFQNASANETVSLWNGGGSNHTVLYQNGGLRLTGTTNSATSGKGRGQIQATGNTALSASTNWTSVRTLIGDYQSGILIFHVQDTGNAANTRCQIYAFNADYYERGVNSIDNVTGGVAPGGIEVRIVRDDGSTTSDGGGPYTIQCRPANGTSSLGVRLLVLSAGTD